MEEPLCTHRAAQRQLPVQGSRAGDWGSTGDRALGTIRSGISPEPRAQFVAVEQNHKVQPIKAVLAGQAGTSLRSHPFLQQLLGLSRGCLHLPGPDPWGVFQSS